MKQWKIFTKTMSIMGKRCVPYLLGIFFMSTAWAFFSVMSSILLKNVVDAAETGNTSQIPLIIAGNVLGGLLSLLIYRRAAIVYNVEAKRAYGTLCKMVFHHEVRLRYTYYEENHSGDFMSKLSYDLEKTGSIYGSRLRRTVAPILQVMVFLVPMLLLSWQISLCLIGVNLVMLLINGLLIEPMKKVSKDLSKINSSMTEKLSNLLQGMEQARMYAAGKTTVDEFVAENRAYAKASNKKLLFTAILESTSTGFDLLCALAFLMVGIYFVQNGHTTLGSLTAIYSLYGSFSFQFLQLGRYLPELIGCMVNAQNIFDFLEEAEEPENWYREMPGEENATKCCDASVDNKKSVVECGGTAEKTENVEECGAVAVKECVAECCVVTVNEKEDAADYDTVAVKNVVTTECHDVAGIKANTGKYVGMAIELDDISFCYREDKPLLQSFSMKVHRGESVAITGASGCGKTTISKLLLGLYPVKEGDIRIFGKSYRQYANSTFRKQIAYVPQEPYLFSGTIKENIRMGKLDATDLEIENAAKIAYAHDFISKLENGYDTNVGERGNNLSGGQRQRIAIARAILKDAPILLLDEATSALDNESENYINLALKSLKDKKTIVMIAHRPSTIALADRECRIG